MIKNFLAAVSLFLFITACGYESIYTSKNLNFTIKNIKKDNTRINNEFENLIRSRNIPDNSNKLDLSLNTTKFKNIKSKDKKGKALIYELNIKLELSVSKNGSDLGTKILSENITYNNNDNKFELKQYEDELEKIIINKLVNETIMYLSKI